MRRVRVHTLIRLLRHVRQPVLVRRLISFLCLPPDMILESAGGMANRMG